MKIDTESGFLVVEKPKLKKVLSEKGLDTELFFIYNVVLNSPVIDSELAPGTPTIIDEELKKYFINNHIYILESKKNVKKYLGHFSSEKELFDCYWELEPVLSHNVPIDIKYE